jgi:hypothetical protein
MNTSLNIIIYIIGATDVHGNPITTNYVVDVIRNNLGYDTRLLITTVIENYNYNTNTNNYILKF